MRSCVYSDITSSLTQFFRFLGLDITRANDAANVLRYINRAKDILVENGNWTGLKKRTTLSFTNRAATLPTDFGKLESIYYEYAGDPNRRSYIDPDLILFSDEIFGQDVGYKRNVEIEFDPTDTIKIEYTRSLPSFTGTATDHSYFSAELMTKCVMFLVMSDSRGGTKEAQDAEMKFYNQLKREYSSDRNFVNKGSRVDPRDDGGNKIRFTSQGL